MGLFLSGAGGYLVASERTRNKKSVRARQMGRISQYPHVVECWIAAGVGGPTNALLKMRMCSV
jgi:hypothetical protein